LLKVDGMLLDTGGCAANTATDLARLGVHAAVAGMVGSDLFGTFILADLARKGLVSRIRVSPALPTSQTVILPVQGQDRRYINSLGANADFTAEDIDRAAIAKSRLLYVGGYLIMPRMAPESLADLFRCARRSGVKTALDVAGVDPSDAMRRLSTVLPFTDVFLPNDDEAALITGEEDSSRQAEAFVRAGAGTVIITRGESGVLVRTREREIQAGVFAVDCVDASGSGDAFAAGFITAMLERWDLDQAIAFASAVGASCCTRLGCTAGVFDRAQATAFVEGHRLAMTSVTRAIG
jgi:sugar/nucleoside kinase (ribokinase family)